MFSGVVVLYYPDFKMIRQIISYCKMFDYFYVIDNTPQKNEAVISSLVQLANVIYIDNFVNMGVAYALNLAVEKCNDRGEKWLFLMDQDSYISKESLQELYHFALTSSENNLAIVAGYYHDTYSARIEENIEVITSGSLVNVDICIHEGKFNEKLYIDEVDNEYCLRVIKDGYRIYRLNYVQFHHCLGHKKIYHNHVTYNYPPRRYYYLIRNALMVAEEYEEFFPELCAQKRMHVKKWIKMVRYEKQKLTKYLYILYGLIDYKFKKTGVCPWKSYQ